MKKKDILKIVERILSKKKYEHTLRVADLAVSLASHYGISKKKAYKAALLHDVGYFVGRSNKNRSLSHAQISARYAKRIGIEDQEILDAIRLHTVGAKDMSMLSKIVFIADSAEPQRSYEGVDKVRKYLYKDIDKAILEYISANKKRLNAKGRRLNRHTVKLRKQLIGK